MKSVSIADAARSRGALQLSAALMLLLVPASASAQAGTQDWCASTRIGPNQHCEVRELRFRAAAGELSIDIGANGSIHVEAYDGTEVRASAQVITRAGSGNAARDLAQQVEVRGREGELRATGPRTRGQDNWSVNVRVQVPAGTALDARTTNGSITVNNTRGPVQARTTNGSIRLSDVVGRVEARSTNGSINAAIADAGARQERIDLRTTNGAIHLAVPERTSAQVELSTTNGRISTDIPITVQGQVTRRRMSGVIGSGGPEIRATTTNGQIRITRR